MSKRGRVPLEIKFGEVRFKALLNTISIQDLAEQICPHEVDQQKKRSCKACKRAIYRASKRLREKDKQEKTFAPIDDFENIPEIKQYVAYSEAKHLSRKDVSHHRNRLRRMWFWVRENPEFADSQRPIMWEEKHIQYILKKVGELEVSRYHWIQALRRFYEANKRSDMLKHQLLRACGKDLRSPKGPKRIKDRFTIEEFKQILSVLNDDEAFIVKMHVTLKCREGDRGHGSLLDLKWHDINWEDTFYGFPMVTATVFEPKTGGGTLWEHCPIDLWFADLSSRLKEKHQEENGDYVFPVTYDEYTTIWNKISDATGEDFQPHDCRRSPSGWLRDLGLSDLAIGQYDAQSGRAVGLAGVGWKNAVIYFQRYGKMNPLAIYERKQRLDTSMFNGLVNKIVEQKERR